VAYLLLHFLYFSFSFLFEHLEEKAGIFSQFEANEGL
jgi:hypothetical protein